MPLRLLPAFLMAVLACWLGLSLLVRATRDRPTQAFAWLCLNLTFYGLATVLPELSRAADVRRALALVQVVETVLLPPVFLHFVAVLVGDGPDVPSRLRAWRRARRARPDLEALQDAASEIVSMSALRRIGAVAFFYSSGMALAAYALLTPLELEPNGTLRFPPILTPIWTAQRVLPMLLALMLMWLSYRQAAGDDLERRRRALFALSAVVGVVGALWATVARNSDLSPALGHTLMDAALTLLAYAVLAYRSLLPSRVAQRTFYRSLLGGLLTALYIGLLLVAEPLASQIIQTESRLPLITIFTLIALIAIFGPLRDWAGAWIDQRFFHHREFDYGRLLRAISDDLLGRGDLAGQLQAALTTICRTLALRDGAVAVQEGAGLRVLATYGADPPREDALRDVVPPDGPQTHYGDWAPWPAARLLLPLRRPGRPAPPAPGAAAQAGGAEAPSGEMLGLLLLGVKRSRDPYRETERSLLSSLGAYLALAIKHARAHEEERLTMAALAEQSRQLQAEQELLAAQATEAARVAAQPVTPEHAPARGLHVYALGPLRVERDGAPIERWGGDKAGTYQAEALFAFLFDRRGRGLTKDEAEEVIWPDLDLDKADTAFHRTISALRRTLHPGIRRANESKLIAYHHERYWLDPSAVDWCDADAFGAAAEHGHTQMRQGDLESARAALAEALELYRGDYMDDCPFFGDSSYVEGRRVELRDQQVDALLTLGAVAERLGRAGEAATCYRRALAARDGDCPRAEEGLARLQMSIA